MDTRKSKRSAVPNPRFCRQTSKENNYLLRPKPATAYATAAPIKGAITDRETHTNYQGNTHCIPFRIRHCGKDLRPKTLKSTRKSYAPVSTPKRPQYKDIPPSVITLQDKFCKKSCKFCKKNCKWYLLVNLIDKAWVIEPKCFEVKWILSNFKSKLKWNWYF